MSRDNGILYITGGELAPDVATALDYDSGVVASKFIGDDNLTIFGASGGFGGVCTDNSGNIYLSDYNYHCIYKITDDGTVSIVAGQRGASGNDGFDSVSADASSFNSPQGLACAPNGDLYICDSNNYMIRVLRNGKVHHVAGSGANGYADGVGADAQFDWTVGCAVDNNGVLYVCDAGNTAIRRIVGANVLTIVGEAGNAGTGDQSGVRGDQTEVVAYPYGVACDASGNVYIADSNNRKIKKLTTDGYVYTVSGTGSYGDAEGDHLTAQYAWPASIAVDKSGVIYVADSSGPSDYGRLVRVTQNGNVASMAHFTDSSERYYCGWTAVMPSGKVVVALSYWFD